MKKAFEFAINLVEQICVNHRFTNIQRTNITRKVADAMYFTDDERAEFLALPWMPELDSRQDVANMLLVYVPCNFDPDAVLILKTRDRAMRDYREEYQCDDNVKQVFSVVRGNDFQKAVCRCACNMDAADILYAEAQACNMRAMWLALGVLAHVDEQKEANLLETLNNLYELGILEYFSDAMKERLNQLRQQGVLAQALFCVDGNSANGKVGF